MFFPLPVQGTKKLRIDIKNCAFFLIESWMKCQIRNLKWEIKKNHIKELNSSEIGRKLKIIGY